MKKIGFVIKHNTPEAHKLAIDLSKFLTSKGLKVAFTRDDAATARQAGAVTVSKQRLPLVADLIIALGGDGTYLRAARLMRTKSVPILGVNMGQLGFLTEIKKDEAFDVLNDMLKGKHLLTSQRSVLEVSLMRGKRRTYKGIAVNDAVVTQGAMARIVGIQVSVNDSILQAVRADGVIVCTPTGSTAYSLAAGGPILDPSLPAIGITTICPHALTQRPIVVPDTAEIKICLCEQTDEGVLTLDGQEMVKMKKSDVVVIKRHPTLCLKLLSSASRDYFSVLREKLKFGLRD